MNLKKKGLGLLATIFVFQTYILESNYDFFCLFIEEITELKQFVLFKISRIIYKFMQIQIRFLEKSAVRRGPRSV